MNQSHESFRRYYIHHEDYVMRFKKNSVRFRDIQKSAKVKIKNVKNKVSLGQVVRKKVIFRIARKEIHRNFHASKHDIKQPSDAT